MGLFDGRHGSGTGSSAHVARLLEAPVILVLDCAHSSATIGAVALGLQRFDPHVNVAGVILNRVASPRHRQTVVDAVQSAGIAVLGVIPRDENLVLSSRHLGLTGPDHPGWTSVVDAAATSMERNVDLDAIEALANAAPPLHAADDIGVRENTGRSVRIAVARDEAFWFYDYTTLETLTDIGAELVYYSPLHDDFPAVDAAFIGGGYPELHATGLAANTAALRSFRDRISAGMPTYAECGGLMYLCDALHVGNERVELVGAIPAAVTMREKRTALRYVQAETLTDGPMFIRGQDVRGHEFHYSSIEYERSSYAYSFDDEREGFSNANVHASYLHLHLGAQRHALERFVNAAKNFGGCA